jgi:hypothetical protein
MPGGRIIGLLEGGKKFGLSPALIPTPVSTTSKRKQTEASSRLRTWHNNLTEPCCVNLTALPR